MGRVVVVGNAALVSRHDVHVVGFLSHGGVGVVVGCGWLTGIPVRKRGYADSLNPEAFKITPDLRDN